MNKVASATPMPVVVAIAVIVIVMFAVLWPQLFDMVFELLFAGIIPGTRTSLPPLVMLALDGLLFACIILWIRAQSHHISDRSATLRIAQHARDTSTPTPRSKPSKRIRNSA